MRKIGVITGTRAEYGILSPVLRKIETSSSLELSLIVASMHLSEKFGFTMKDIIDDGFEINEKIDVLQKQDTPVAMARSLGRCVCSMADAFETLKPDMILVLGDRSEMLAASITAAYMNIPIAHVHGGEISGNIDDSARHAITKFAHIHFPATTKSGEMIRRMGEESWRVHVVGAPGLDSILNGKLMDPIEIAKKFELKRSEPVILMVQHPVTTETESATYHIKETLNAIVELGYQTILVYPNADAGGRRMIDVIKSYEQYQFIKTFKSLPHGDYLGLMGIASVLVGNSSSGIIEAPSFHLPVVNIGTRQQGRERAENIIDTGYNEDEIVTALNKALSDVEFKEKVKRCKNPYGDGKASERIVRVLSETKINNKLLQKRTVYQ